MKTTMYELLGMVKDGKAPKRIKSEGHYYTYNELEKDYYEGTGYDYEYLFKNTSNDNLNDEVEILEEPKGIPEKINCWYNYNGIDDKELTKIMLDELKDKINEILDYLESKGK